MKRMIWQVGVVVLLLAGGAGVGRAARIPGGTKTDVYPAAASISLTLDGTTNCAVLLTGFGSITRSNFFNNTTNSTVTLQTEIESLDLVGTSPTFGTVRLLVGSNLVGQVSSGMISGDIKTNFPATSFFNTFLAVQVSGTNLVNLTPLLMQADILQVPPISQIYTNATPIPLVDAANHGHVVAQLNQLWFSLAEKKTAKSEVGLSLNVFGTNTLGVATLLVCPSSSEVAATINLKNSNYSGAVTPNAGCDELGETNLLFACAWNSQLRAPNWQGGHDGNWVIYTLGARGQTNVFAFGTLEGSSGVGTHRAPLSVNAEDCSSCQHFEGGLIGHIIAKGTLQNAEIKASYAGEHLDDLGNPIHCCPPPPTPPTGFFLMTIDGVAITDCLQP